MKLVLLGEAIIVNVTAGPEKLKQGIDFVFESVFRRLVSGFILVDVDVAEQQETVRAVARVVAFDSSEDRQFDASQHGVT